MNPIKRFTSRILKKIRNDEAMEEKLARWRSLGAAIGKNIFIGFDVVIDEGFAEFLTIEDNVVIAARTFIILHDSALNNISGDPIRVGKVTLKEQAYIGANVTILPGVTIGSKAIVGAGSVVTRDVPDGMVAVGNPAAVRTAVSTVRSRLVEQPPRPGIFHWDILPWRERREKMTAEEIHESYTRFVDQARQQKS